MASKRLLTDEQEQQVIDAIQEAEKKTSGEIRVHIEEKCEVEPLERASRIFHELGMDQTELQNGILIYIASEEKKAAVYAGKGIHKQVEDGFWSDVLQKLLAHFKQQNYAQGLVEAVQMVADKLEALFPYRKGDTNELSNDISYS